MGMACSTHGSEEECMYGFGGKKRRKELLRRIRSRWVDNIKMDLREIKWGCMDWIRLSQDMDQGRALVSTIMNTQFWDILE
jgi:hypothetical protein